MKGISKTSEQTQDTDVTMSLSPSQSTSSSSDVKPYWTADCLEMSRKLLSLTATERVGSDLNVGMTWPSNTTLDAWFFTHLHLAPKYPSYRTLLESFTSFPPDFTQTDATVVRSKKLRIYPKKHTTRHWNRYRTSAVKSVFAARVAWIWIEITKALAGFSCGLCRLRPPHQRRFAWQMFNIC